MGKVALMIVTVMLFMAQIALNYRVYLRSFKLTVFISIWQFLLVYPQKSGWSDVRPLDHQRATVWDSESQLLTKTIPMEVQESKCQVAAHCFTRTQLPRAHLHLMNSSKSCEFNSQACCNPHEVIYTCICI